MTARQGHAVQNNFSGGEISSRMLMRIDTEMYAKALLNMENFYPNLQGSAERTPGSRFLLDTGLVDGRIFPYLTPDNERALILLGEDSLGAKSITMWTGINQAVARNGGGAAPVSLASSLIKIREQVIENFNFNRGEKGWTLEPRAEPSPIDQNLMGAWWKPINDGTMQMRVRKFKGRDPETVTIRGEGQITTATDSVNIRLGYQYVNNVPFGGGRIFTIKIGTTQGGQDLLNYTSNSEIGDVHERAFVADLPGGSYTGPVYVTVTLTAVEGIDEKNSTPWFRMLYCGVWAEKEVDIGNKTIEIRNASGTPIAEPPWDLADLPDIHYVQSPYNRELDSKPSKELVLTHRNVPPHRLYFDTVGVTYVLEPIDFTNTPPLWSDGNYPATCSSCMGRLILAGGNNVAEAGSPNGSNTETVWATKVAEWDAFSQPDEVNADDSLEFTTIYRSPIQWVHGQKELFVGTQEMEYIARADGIFAPNDLGTDMHSTHGGARVQPVGLGVGVAFAAENGTRVRLMTGSNESMGFISPDLTLYNPEICLSGITRMQRMRNPHQMVVCALGNGTMAFYHYDPQGAVEAWSRYLPGGFVRDIATLSDNETGDDNLYTLIRRSEETDTPLYLEVIDNWVDSERWVYMQSFVQHSEGAFFSTIGAVGTPSEGILAHLEGDRVMVVTEQGYLGVYTVTGGEITLTNEVGTEYEVLEAWIGKSMESEIRTLPVVGPTGDPGALHRFSDISVRTRGSTRPKIEVLSFNEASGEFRQRFEDRTPGTLMDNPEPRDLIVDLEAANLGTDIYQVVVIRETLPLRCEILGIYGKLTGASL